MTKPSYYKQLFRDLVADSISLLGANYEIKYFVYGDIDRVMASLRSDVDYPLLWLEYTQETLQDAADNFTQSTKIDFSLLRNIVLDDYDQQDTIIDEVYELATQVIKYLKNQNLIWGGDTIMLEPIRSELTDNCYGYRVSLTIRHIETNFMA